MTADPVALRVTDLRCGYDDLEVVRGASFSLQAGRICAMFGRNGAGKTTTLRGVAGLNSAHGTVVLGGDDISSVPPWQRSRKGLGLVLEGKRVFRDLTVHENLRLSAVGRASRGTDAIASLYDRFPMLREKRTSAAGSLSGGQQQLLSIACALVLEPQVLLIDEPSSGLSPKAVDEIFAFISEVRDDGMAILLVEQLVDRVLGGIADDVLLFDAGRVVGSGTADDIDLDQVIDAFGLSDVS